MVRSRPTPSVTPDLILRAYAAGLFPMAEDASDPDLYWVDPDRRGVFPLDGLSVSRSLRRTVRSDRFTIAVDRDFDAVIDGCAAAVEGRAKTWINPSIRRLYRTLFERGHVHTVEARHDGVLVGGLYGVSLGAAFFGESMFHRMTDASKVCLVHLVASLVEGGFELLDAQFITPHLTSLGAIEIDRADYHRRLAHALSRSARFPAADGRPRSGSEALDVAGRTGPYGYLPAGSRPPNSFE